MITCVNQKRDGALEPVLRKRLVDGLQHFQLRVPVQTVPAFDLISKLCVGGSFGPAFCLTPKIITSVVVVPARSMVSKRLRSNSRSSSLLLVRVCLTVKLMPPPAAWTYRQFVSQSGSCLGDWGAEAWREIYLFIGCSSEFH